MVRPIDNKLLEPDFDLNSLKKVELEKLLTDNEIPFLKRSNKSELSSLIRRFIIEPEIERLEKEAIKAEESKQKKEKKEKREKKEKKEKKSKQPLKHEIDNNADKTKDTTDSLKSSPSSKRSKSANVTKSEVNSPKTVKKSESKKENIGTEKNKEDQDGEKADVIKHLESILPSKRTFDDLLTPTSPEKKETPRKTKKQEKDVPSSPDFSQYIIPKRQRVINDSKPKYTDEDLNQQIKETTDTIKEIQSILYPSTEIPSLNNTRPKSKAEEKQPSSTENHKASLPDFNQMLQELNNAPRNAEASERSEKRKKATIIAPVEDLIPNEATKKTAERPITPNKNYQFNLPDLNQMLHDLNNAPRDAKSSEKHRQAASIVPAKNLINEDSSPSVRKSKKSSSPILGSSKSSVLSKKNTPKGPKKSLQLTEEERDKSKERDTKASTEIEKQKEKTKSEDSTIEKDEHKESPAKSKKDVNSFIEHEDEDEDEEEIGHISVHSEPINLKETEDEAKITTPSIAEEEEILSNEQEKLTDSINNEHSQLEDAKEIQNEEEETTIPIGKFLKYFSLWCFTLLITFSVVVYRVKRIEVGFCGSEIKTPLFNNFDRFNPFASSLNPIIDDVNEFLTPACVPCPSHATCYKYSQLVCDPDYILTKTWKSIFGLLPTYQTCKVDSIKLQKTKTMFKMMLHLLRQQNAQLKCGEGSIYEVGITVGNLEKFMFNVFSKRLTTPEFKDIFNKIMLKLQELPEIEILEVSDEDGELDFASFLIRSNSQDKVGLRCKIEKLFTRTLIKFQKYLIIFVSIIGLTFLIKRYYLTYRKESEFRKSLSSDIIQRLRKQKANAEKDSKQQTPNYLSSIQLRDFYLQNDQYSHNEKNKIWSKISKILESNSNVKTQTIEVHGEIMKVWEWISDF